MARATEDRAKWWPGPRPVIFALAAGCLVTFLAFDLVMQDSVPLTGGLAAVLGGAVSLPGSFEPTWIGEHAVVGVRRDAFGVEYLEVHALQRT